MLKRFALTGVSQAHFAPPFGFKHIELYFSGRGVVASVIGPNVGLRFNGDTAANYDQPGIQQQGAGVASNSAAGQTYAVMGIVPGSTATANCVGEGWAKILNFTDGQRRKICHTGGGMTGADASGASYIHRTHTTVWRNTFPIHLITLFSDNGNFDYGSFVDFVGVR